MTTGDPVPDDPAAVVRRVLDERGGQDGALLPVLHGVQEALGHVPLSVLAQIGEALNLSRAEVYGVVTYYHHFRTTPPGRTVVQVCRAESCRTMGAEGLLAQARARLGCTEHAHDAADGSASVEPAYCLGLCASSPAITLNGRLHARVTAERLDALLGACA